MYVAHLNSNLRMLYLSNSVIFILVIRAMGERVFPLLDQIPLSQLLRSIVYLAHASYASLNNTVTPHSDTMR